MIILIQLDSILLEEEIFPKTFQQIPVNILLMRHVQAPWVGKNL